MSMDTWGQSAAVLAAAAALCLAGCQSRAGKPEAERVVRVAPVSAASEQSVEVYPGEVRARYESALGFRVAGKIRSRKVDLGAHVVTGQVLAELDPQDLELARSSARAGLASAQAALDLAKSEHARFAALRERNFVSQFELDAKANALEAARAHVTEARALLDTASNQAGYADLRADADGVIMAISGEPGQVVGAGQTIMMLAHDGTTEVEIDVPELAVANLAVGRSAQVEMWTGDGGREPARVREIAPSADPVTRTYRVRVALDAASTTAKLGQTARVYFSAAALDGQFVVPLSALHEKDGKPALWTIDRKTRKLHLAQVGLVSFSESGAVINQGVAGDTWVVTAGVHRLREGESVRPIDAMNRPVEF